MHKSTDFRPENAPPAEGFLSREFRLFDRYELQGLLVEALENTTHHKHVAEKVLNCHKRFRHRRCDQNHNWARAENSCSCRVCPHCAHRRAKMLGERIKAFVVGKDDLRYLVLAEKNCRSLKQGIESLWKAWTVLRRSVRWKAKVKGSIAVLEVTYNKRNRTWHPHLNVLMQGEYFPFAELNQLWVKATRGKGRTTHIQKAGAGTVDELLKYTLKVAERTGEETFRLVFDEPAALDEYLSATHGARLLRSYGTFRGIKLSDEELPEEECPDCGSKCIIDMGRVNHHQLTFDFEKEVFRVNLSAQEIVARARRATEFHPFEYTPNPYASAMAVEGRRRAARYERIISEEFSRQLAA